MEKWVTEILDVCPLLKWFATCFAQKMTLTLVDAAVSRGDCGQNASFLHFLFISQFPRLRSRRHSSCDRAPRISSSSSTPTPSWGTDRSSGGKSSTAPAIPCWPRPTASGRSPTRCGIWSRTQSTASVSCSPGRGRAARGLRGRRSSAGQSVQVSRVETQISSPGLKWHPSKRTVMRFCSSVSVSSVQSVKR